MSKVNNKKIKKPNLFNLGGPLQMPSLGSMSGAQASIDQLDLQNMKLPPIAAQTRGLNFAGGLGLVGTASSLLQSGLSNAKIADTSGISERTELEKNRVVHSNTNDELLNEWGSWNKLRDDYSWREVRGGSNKQRAFNTLSSTGQGAMSGLSVGGPIGGIVGGVVGLGSAIGGWFRGNRRAKRKARRLNQAAADANDRTLDSFTDKAFNIDTQNDFVRQSNYFADGGLLNTNIFSNKVQFINEGGTHEQNPNGGVQMGIDEDGTPNLVEEGEVIYNGYVFSDRITLPEEMKKQYKYKGNTFAEVAKNIQKESSERPNDPISKRGLDVNMQRLSSIQNIMKEKKDKKQKTNQFAKGGFLGTNTRYAPIVGSGLGALTGMLSKPDYTEADKIAKFPLQANTVTTTPITQKLAYNPLDRDFYLNRADKQNRASIYNIINTSGGNRATAQAGILANNFNYQSNLGNFARQSEEYNTQQKERVNTFNRQTDTMNNDQNLRANIFNAGVKNQLNQLGLQQAQTAAAMRQAIKEKHEAGINTNTSGFLQGLGDLGWENQQRNWLDQLARAGVFKIDTKGNFIKG